MSMEQAIHELQEQLQRVSAGHQAMHPRIECSPQYGRYEGTYLVGGAEESDARSVREEERPELENLVELGKVLRRSSAFSA